MERKSFVVICNFFLPVSYLLFSKKSGTEIQPRISVFYGVMKAAGLVTVLTKEV